MNPVATNFDPTNRTFSYGDEDLIYHEDYSGVPILVQDRALADTAMVYDTATDQGTARYQTDTMYTQQQHPPQWTIPDQPLQWQQESHQPYAVEGSYYEFQNWPAVLPHTTGPISAVSYDEHGLDALYVATPTQSVSQRRHLQRRSIHRAAWMVTHVPWNGALYSSVASHKEATATILNQIYGAVYSSNTNNEGSFLWDAAATVEKRKVPRHSYQPPYGKTDPTNPEALPYIDINDNNQSNNITTYNYQMGVTTILSVAHGVVASVSPSGVRLHKAGGLQLADLAMEGLLAGTIHPGNTGVDTENIATHLTVGGLAWPDKCNNKSSLRQQKSMQQIHYVDLWQDLRVVASHSCISKDTECLHRPVTVTTMATNTSRGCIAVGCSDGNLRLVDSRHRDLACIPSHRGGVVSVAVQGDLVATTGFGPHPQLSPPNKSFLYAFPDPTVLVSDLRYLGRGNFPHSFAGAQGGPRYLSFVPDVMDGNYRLFVVSGQPGGGCQFFVPFQQDSVDVKDFFLPSLYHMHEAVSCLSVSEDKLALGTSQGRIIQYKMQGYKSPTISSHGSVTAPGRIFIPSEMQSPSKISKTVKTNESLASPPYQVSPSLVSLDPTMLCKDPNNPSAWHGFRKQCKSFFGSFVLTVEPTVSSLCGARDPRYTSFGPLSTSPLILQSCLILAPSLINRSYSSDLDSTLTFPASQLENDILQDLRPEHIRARDIRKGNKPQTSRANYNKLIYTDKLFKELYVESFNRSKLYRERSRRHHESKNLESNEIRDAGDNLIKVPSRYRLTIRPANKSSATFFHSDWNKTGVIPGYDHPITMANSFASPVLLLLYFIPEFRTAALNSQYIGRPSKSLTGTGSSISRDSDRQGLLTEIGYLFHRIESLSRYALLFPTREGITTMKRVEAWCPTSLLSFLATMPEADRFQILDGSPAAVNSPRRPEAFFRFLMYQLGNEMDHGAHAGLLNDLGGIDFVSVNEYISGSAPPSLSTTRQLTIDLSYEHFRNPEFTKQEGIRPPCFGDVLQHNLCKEARLRAWSDGSKSYETIVQRKIVTSLPAYLTLAAACAGRKEEDGMMFWRNHISDHWLPELLEIELSVDGSVVVREFLHDVSTEHNSWRECKGTNPISHSVSKVVLESTMREGAESQLYRLDAVISYIRDDFDRSCPEEIQEQDGPKGHHVLHVRVPKSLKRELIQQQLDTIMPYLCSESIPNVSDMTLVGMSANVEIFKKRCDFTQSQLECLDKEQSEESTWVLINGFNVTETVIEDARAFHVSFKEPSVLLFKAIDDLNSIKESGTSTSLLKRASTLMKAQSCRHESITIPPEVILTHSITNFSRSPHAVNQRPSVLPRNGDVVAFDAEFVAVSEEESILTLSGSKVTIREVQHALARISVLDCRPDSNGSVILDDHVQPKEVVTDYLTRFSGIVEDDLNPKKSKHHLISPQTAYLKLRCLVERGCVFVGHGLQQDFWTANLVVPANQIIDTVEIYHKPAQRYISLRFLANFVLQRKFCLCVCLYFVYRSFIIILTYCSRTPP